MSDGLRWQEIFRGAELALINKKFGGVEDVPRLKILYWRDNEEERRRKLLPFIWGTLAHDGQIYGDRDRHSDAAITNGLNFSWA